jgi:cold shock CspA family protein
VKFYNPEKGFGFISPDRGGRDVFVHTSVLNRVGIANLAEGQRVSVDVIDGKKGPEAVSLRLICAGRAPGATTGATIIISTSAVEQLDPNGSLNERRRHR